MNAEQVIAHHVKRARRHNHSLIQNLRLRKSLSDMYRRFRDEHMAMAYTVKSLARSAFLYECM